MMIPDDNIKVIHSSISPHYHYESMIQISIAKTLVSKPRSLNLHHQDFDLQTMVSQPPPPRFQSLDHGLPTSITPTLISISSNLHHPTSIIESPPGLHCQTATFGPLPLLLACPLLTSTTIGPSFFDLRHHCLASIIKLNSSVKYNLDFAFTPPSSSYHSLVSNVIIELQLPPPSLRRQASTSLRRLSPPDLSHRATVDLRHPASTAWPPPLERRHLAASRIPPGHRRCLTPSWSSPSPSGRLPATTRPPGFSR